MKIKQVMSQPAIVVREDSTLEEIARTMLERNIGSVPVVDQQGKISGVITESDFTAKEKGVPFSTFRAPQLFGQWMDRGVIEALYEKARNLKAKEIMSHDVVTVTEDQPVDDALALLLKHGIHHLPVVRDQVPVGVISRHDLLRIMAKERAVG
jgi:CBS domain-containing protein